MLALYRIAQEAMHNTVKHAQTGRIDVRLACQAGRIVLEVGDTGPDCDPANSFPGHLGLRSMCERATQLGGTLQIESAPGRGTCVRAEITYAAEHPPSSTSSADALLPLNNGVLSLGRPRTNVVDPCACHASRSLGLFAAYTLGPLAA
jgi:Histidine kinase-, DNA gyrase B-, and HSP90-like ATPase